MRKAYNTGGRKEKNKTGGTDGIRGEVCNRDSLLLKCTAQTWMLLILFFEFIISIYISMNCIYVYLSFYLPIYVSMYVYLSIYVSIYLYIYLSFFLLSIYLSMYLCLSNCLSIYRCLPTHLCISFYLLFLLFTNTQYV